MSPHVTAAPAHCLPTDPLGKGPQAHTVSGTSQILRMAGLKIMNTGKDHWGTHPLPEWARPGVRGTHALWFGDRGLVSVHSIP